MSNRRGYHAHGMWSVPWHVRRKQACFAVPCLGSRRLNISQVAGSAGQVQKTMARAFFFSPLPTTPWIFSERR